MGYKDTIVINDDAAALLAPVLERIQPVIGDACYITGLRRYDSEHPALLVNAHHWPPNPFSRIGFSVLPVFDFFRQRCKIQRVHIGCLGFACIACMRIFPSGQPFKFRHCTVLSLFIKMQDSLENPFGYTFQMKKYP